MCFSTLLVGKQRSRAHSYRGDLVLSALAWMDGVSYLMSVNTDELIN